MIGLRSRDEELSEILDGNREAFERRRRPGSDVSLADAQQMIVDTIERMERVTFGNTVVVDALLRTACRRAGDERPVRLLEVASGNGWLVCSLARRARRCGIEVELTGSDLNPVLVESMRRRLRHERVAAGALVADAADLSGMADGSFDLAVISLSLHHLPPPVVPSALREMDRVSGGGMVVVDICRSLHALVGLPPLAALVAPARGRRFAVHDTAVTVRRAYTVAELRAQVEVAGLGDRYRVGRLPVLHPERFVTVAIFPR